MVQSQIQFVARSVRDPAVWLGLATFFIAIWLYDFDADGAFAIWDGLWYGHFAEHHPAQSILPHHPLFHACVAALTWVFGKAGIAQPGHLAIRVIAGIGGALVLVLVARLAGPGRRAVGAAFALVLFSSRAFIAEAATGENLLPGFAGALLLLELATRERPDLRKLGAALVLALLLRQDNLLLLPGALAATAAALPPGRRLLPLARMVAIAGVLVLGLYVLAWAWAHTQTGESLVLYLIRFAHTARWEGHATVVGNLLLHFGAFGGALVGRHWFGPLPHMAVGFVWLVGVAFGAWALRGAEPSRRYAAAVLITLAIRFPLYAWFEPHNFEWQVLPIVLLAALGSRTARGAPVAPRRTRVLGATALVLLATLTIAFHAENTCVLRQRRLASAVNMAIDAAGSRAYFLPVDKNATIALELRLRQYDQLDVPFGDPLDSVKDLAFRKRRELDRPIVVITDRYIGSGMPLDLEHAAEALPAFDAVSSTPELTVLQWEGRNFAAILK